MNDSKAVPQFDPTQPFEFLGFPKPPGGVVIDDEDVWTGPGLPGEPLDQTPKFDPTQPFEFLGFAKPRLKPAPIQDLSSEAPPSSFDDASQTVPPPQSPAAPVSGNSFPDFELEPLSPAELERMARRYGPLKGQPRLSGSGIPPSPPPDVNRPDQPPSFRAVPGPAPDPNTPKYREPNEKIIPGFWSDGTPDNGALPNVPAPEVTSPIPPSASNEAPPKDAAPPAQAPKPAPVQPAPAPNGGPRIQAPQPEPEPEYGISPIDSQPEQEDQSENFLPPLPYWPEERPEAFNQEPLSPELLPSREALPLPQLTLPEQMHNAGNSFLQAAVSGIPDSLETIAFYAHQLGKDIPPPWGNKGHQMEDQDTYKMAQALRQFAQSAAPVDPRTRDTFFAGELPTALGNAAGFLAGGEMGKSVPAAHTAYTTIKTAAQGFMNAYQDARNHGADEEAARKLGLIGIASNMAQMVVPMRILHGLGKPTASLFKKAMREGHLQAALTLAQQIVTDLAGHLYYGKEWTQLDKTLKESGAQGAAVVFQTYLQALLGRRGLVVPKTKAGSVARAPETGRPEGQLNQYPKNSDDIEHRRYAHGEGGGMAKEAVTRVTQEMSQRWRNMPKVNVTSEPELLHNGRPVAGYYDPIRGEVVLNAAYLGDPDQVRRVFAEEVVAHHGLRQIFNEPELNAKLKELGERIDKSQLEAVAHERGLDLGKEKQRLLAIEEYIAKEAQTEQGNPLWKQYLKEIQRVIQRSLGFEPNESEVQQLLRRSNDFLRGYYHAPDHPLFRMLKDLGSHEKSFQSSKDLGQARTPAQIADKFSRSGKEIDGAELIPGKKITFWSARGDLTGTINKEVRQIVANSEWANSRGFEKGGGSELYQALLAYAHQNGLVAVSDGLTEINKLRRTSNMLSSALRFGTTQHMLPYESQGVPWRTENSPEAFAMNVMALADAESQRSLKTTHQLQRYTYDFKSGRIKDQAGDVFSQQTIAALVHELDRGHTNGIGETTAMRAIITHSARELEKRGLLFNERLDSERHKGLLYSYGATRKK